MKKETALNFLLFSYFGVTLEDDKEAFVTAAISREYIDMASHVLIFDFEKCVKTDKDKEVIRYIYKKEAAECLRKGLVEQIHDFRKWHYGLAVQIENVYARELKYGKQKVCKKVNLPFGMAQKWINMTIKYIFILDTIISDANQKDSELKDICKKINNIELLRVPDIPVDDYIIKAACDNQVAIPRKSEDEEYSYDKKIKSGYYNKLPWSSWNWTDVDKKNCRYYEEFQEELKSKFGDAFVLDYENELWIEEAKKRRNKEIDSRNKLIEELYKERS